MSWSGGKDSAMALYKIQNFSDLEVVSLHTSFDKKLKRVGLHGIPEALIEKQAESIGLPLEKIYLPQDTSHGSYEAVMKEFCEQQVEKGVEGIVFGDIFLEDLKAYREKQLDAVGLEALFPLWHSPTLELVKEFIGLDFKTLICCLNAQLLPKSMLGKTLDDALISEIAALADPCGERGEFHTFVFDGPLFKFPVPYSLGGAVLKSYHLKKVVDGKTVQEEINFWFQEVLSA